MSQPLDRTKRLDEIGPLDRELGEFWVDNPFLMPAMGENLSAYETNCLFLNRGGLEFIDASFTSQVDLDADSRSATPIDFDRNGSVDLLVGSVGGGPLRLFKNQVSQGHWIGIRLHGIESNRHGIGARIRIHTQDQTIHRELFPTNGFFGANPHELVVGLGPDTVIQRLEVEWPNGHVSTWNDLAADRWVICREDDTPL